MANLIPFMFADVGAPVSCLAFASDAQGSGGISESDHGGFGIVAADMPRAAIDKAWAGGFAPGRAITRLDGTLGSRWKFARLSAPTIPFSRLPRDFFATDWTVLSQGRWAWSDHFTLGEARAHVHIARALASVSRAHHSRYLALQDNAPTSCSMMKGRSPSPALNYYCRKRGASLLASQIILAAPWVETSLQPADEASRDRPQIPGSASSKPDPGSVFQKVSPCARTLPCVAH